MDDAAYHDLERIMLLPELARFFGVSKRSVQRMWSDGRLKKVTIGPRTVGSQRRDAIHLATPR